jgi:nitrogen-specific signal transduction histidine kinase/CheY-like chemotaxis protein
MEEGNLPAESLLFQWNFFERAISNYSIIIKMFQHMEGERDLLAHMPRIFVEETIFDTCELVMRAESKGSFFSINGALKSVGADDLEQVKGPIFSPTILHRVFGYGTLYVYPLKRSIHVFGYLLLGKKQSVALDANILRDLELLCEILNRFILLNMGINELKQAESAKMRQLDSRLATTRTLLENVIDQFPHSLFLLDRNGIICFANKKARLEFLEARESTGEKIEEVVGGIEKGFLEKDFMLQGELHHRRGDDYKLYSLESYPIKDNKGKVVFKSLVLKDVIEERVEEEESTYRSRMETIGRLAGGVAHDFNNVLTGILGYASLMKRMVPENYEQLARYAEIIENSAKRAATLTEHLLNFSRRQRVTAIDVIDLNGLLGDVLFLVRESFRTVTIEKQFDESLPPIKGDPGQLQHTFLNLCVNAKDAMGEGGTLTISTGRETSAGGQQFVFVKIHDTGPGIDEEVKGKVFEPFYTTKTESQKLGMGLYLVQKVVKSHGGFIELESAKGQGTTFTLYFPCANGEKEPSPGAAAPAKAVRKGAVLVVDDEEVVRELLARVLSQEGVEVLQAENGAEALTIFEGRAESIDLVILDMIMPGMRGEEVLGRLRDRRRSVKVVISSGFMSEEQREKLKEIGVQGFLDKPYGEMEVVSMVRSMLAGSKEDRSE